MVKSARQENAVKEGETSSWFKFDDNAFHDDNDKISIFTNQPSCYPWWWQEREQDEKKKE
jgi:hypothetical protein